MKGAKVNSSAIIISGTLKGFSGIVVAADFFNEKVFVKVKLDKNTLVEVTSDMIEQE